MGELVIRYHDFENAKKEIKKFSEQTTTDLELKRVNNSKDIGEIFGDWFFGRGIGLEHKVTGEELNELTSQIQKHLYSINNTQIKLIKEFGQVYKALEALDKDYIKAILISIKATEETSRGILETQGQIKKIIENQRKTLEELKKFKQKLDGYVHLGEIDEIWKQTEEHQLRINKVEQEDKSHIDKLKELEQTDSRMSESIDSNTCDIILLKEYKDKLCGIFHLYDVDSIWKDVKEHTSKLVECERRDENFAYIIQKNREEVNENIAEAVQTTNIAVKSLTKKIKYAYWIAGGSAGLAVIELILLLMKVI